MALLEGEIITTVVDGKEETVNTAVDGDYVVCLGCHRLRCRYRCFLPDGRCSYGFPINLYTAQHQHYSDVRAKASQHSVEGKLYPFLCDYIGSLRAMDQCSCFVRGSLEQWTRDVAC